MTYDELTGEKRKAAGEGRRFAAHTFPKFYFAMNTGSEGGSGIDFEYRHGERQDPAPLPTPYRFWPTTRGLSVSADAVHTRDMELATLRAEMDSYRIVKEREVKEMRADMEREHALEMRRAVQQWEAKLAAEKDRYESALRWEERVGRAQAGTVQAGERAGGREELGDTGGSRACPSRRPL